MKLPFGFELVKRSGGTFLRRRPLSVTGRRSFAAAQDTDLTYSWASTPRTINGQLAEGLTSLRTRSRDLAMNSDHGAKFIKLVKGNVIGPKGVVLQARSQNKDGSLDDIANDAIETAFREWGESDSCSMCGTLGWVDIQNLFASSLAADGEVIFRKLYGPGAGPWGFALSQIDPALLDVGYNAELASGAVVVMGIELDGWQRPIAYHFRDEGVGNQHYRAQNGYAYIRIPAEDIIHAFLPEWVGQLRGVPWMAPAMLRMKMFHAFEEAAVINARIGASKVGIITTPGGDQFTGADAIDTVTGDQLIDADPGSWLTAAEGQTLQSWDPAYPSGDFADFSKSILQSISSGLGVDYAGLTSDLEGVNYSSIRAGLVETREAWKGLQEWTIRALARPVYNEWLGWALLAGQIQAGSTPLPVRKEWKFKRVRFQGRRWSWVDPLKDLQAAKLAIDEGLASRTEIIMDRGRDPDDVWAEIEMENTKLDGKNITVGAAAGPAGGNDDGNKDQA